MRWLPSSCVLLVLCGCSVHYSSRSESAAGSTRIDVSSGTPLGNAVLMGIVASEAMSYRDRTSAPPPDPTRRINIQDCTRPFDPTAGNLMCR